MSSPPPLTPEQQSFSDWVARVKRMHRNKRYAGLAGCAVGILLMVWTRFGGGPEWALPLGLGIVVACWLVFGWIVWARWRWVKQNPFDPA